MATPDPPVPTSWRTFTGLLIVAAGGRITLPERLLVDVDPDSVTIIVTRDVKTGGVIYEATITPKITDADIARLIDMEGDGS